MKRTIRQIAALAAVLLVVCAGYRLAIGNRYTAFVSMPRARGSAPEVRAVSIDPGRLEAVDAQARDGGARVQLRPLEQGVYTVHILDESGAKIAGRSFRVTPLRTIYDPSTGGFTGDSLVMAAFTLFCFAAAALMLRCFLKTPWPDFYAYSTIYAAGFSLFALSAGITSAFVTARHLLDPVNYPMLSAYREVSRSGFRFIAVTSPLVAAFSLAMAVSNLALMRHEGPKPKNALGILAGVLLMAGMLVARRLFRPGAPSGLVPDTIRGVYATGFAYFECMLAGAVICALKAARHRPAGDRDVLLILGCRFRRDGSLTPLLQGRVDRALDFWREQRRATGKAALLIPSGGQGPDEPMPEAMAMERYILAQGIPARYLRPESRSRNTFENMTCSRALIAPLLPEAKVAFVTTNYHVFRSGVWARLAGLPAEGIGSRTRWWYWPNAFMRECLGLLRRRWLQELGLLVMLAGFFAVLSMMLR